MLKHGGRLYEAAQQYQIPLHRWLDLSTGINPEAYPIPAIPNSVWQRLPEEQDQLLSSASDYYQCDALLAVAGSQAAIQSLPLLRPRSAVGILSPSYAEHAHAWQKAGHHTRSIAATDIDSHLNQLEVLILVNPNNPTGQRFDPQQCLTWLASLNKKKGWLIIDEAFIDCTPELSLSTLAPLPGLIILRSIGKFFGLAGIRVGFVLAEPAILNALNEILGPWSVSNPSRFVCQHALQNTVWQKTMRKKLQQQSQHLSTLLQQHRLPPHGGTKLFQWVKTKQAQKIHRQLAQQAIFTRLFTQPASLRFGLPANNSQMQTLAMALQKITL